MTWQLPLLKRRNYHCNLISYMKLYLEHFERYSTLVSWIFNGCSERYWLFVIKNHCVFDLLRDLYFPGVFFQNFDSLNKFVTPDIYDFSRKFCCHFWFCLKVTYYDDTKCFVWNYALFLKWAIVSFKASVPLVLTGKFMW